MKRGLLWMLALLLVVAFVGLGRWQLGRAQEKQALLAANAKVLSERRATPLDRVARAPAQALDWIETAGAFDARDALLLDNQTRGGRAGVRVYRVFVPHRAAPLLVDLGWLPLPGDRVLPAVPRPEGELVLRGLLAPPPSAGLALGGGIERREHAWLLTRVDIAAIGAAVERPLLARVLRLDPALQLPGLPDYARDLDALANTLPPEKHRGYALQWFALAAGVAVAALVVGLRRERSVWKSAR